MNEVPTVPKRTLDNIQSIMEKEIREMRLECAARRGIGPQKPEKPQESGELE